MFILLLIFGLLIAFALFAKARVGVVFEDGSKQPLAGGLTGGEAARRILAQAGVTDVQVVERNAYHSDYYDLMKKKVVLSEGSYRGRTAVSVGVAAHEAGHALQHASEYSPLAMRMSAVRATHILGGLFFVLPIIFALLTKLNMKMGMMICVIGWSGLLLFNLLTLSVEIDASVRSRRALQKAGLIKKGSDTTLVNKVINAAAVRELGAIIESPKFLLFSLLPFGGGRR
jgi:Zn-dependent membrane protease YugP